MDRDARRHGDTGASWRALLGRRHRGAITVLAGGVGLYATNVFLTTSLLPSAIHEIGGAELYAWATTTFLLGSVVTSVLVSRLLAATGGRRAYLVALCAFSLGTVVCASAPSMEMLLVGRAVQGAGGGLLAGLGYALIRNSLPAALWARATALVSAMWGVGTFLGPVLGGAFSEFLSWRAAFVVLAVGAVGLAVIVPRALSGTRPQSTREPFPVVSLVLVTLAALSISVASILPSPLLGLAGVALGLVVLAAFVAHERRTDNGVLPAATFRAGSPLRWIYATIAVLSVGSTAETFVPLFGQDLAGLAPLAAGFLGAALAAGWTLGDIPSASASRDATTRRVVVLGPLVLAVGLAATAASQSADAGTGTVLVWALTLLVAGAGIGIAWPHLATTAMGSARDETEGDKASAAINTVQLISNAIGAASTGVLVNLGGVDPVLSARLLFGTFAGVAVLGVVTAALAATRPSRVPATAAR